MNRRIADQERRNVELVHVGVNRLNARDFDHVLDGFSEDYVLHNTGLDQPVRGLEAYRKVLEEEIEQMPDIVFRIEQTIPAGEWVSVRYTARGTKTNGFMGLPPTDRPYSFNGGVINRFCNGLRIESWNYWNPMMVLDQIREPTGERSSSRQSTRPAPRLDLLEAGRTSAAEELLIGYGEGTGRVLSDPRFTTVRIDMFGPDGEPRGYYTGVQALAPPDPNRKDAWPVPGGRITDAGDVPVVRSDANLKMTWFLNDRDSLTIVGDAIARTVVLRDGSTILWSPTACLITEGSGKYEGALGIVSEAAAGVLPAGDLGPGTTFHAKVLLNLRLFRREALSRSSSVAGAQGAAPIHSRQRAVRGAVASGASPLGRPRRASVPRDERAPEIAIAGVSRGFSYASGGRASNGQRTTASGEIALRLRFVASQSAPRTGILPPGVSFDSRVSQRFVIHGEVRLMGTAGPIACFGAGRTFPHDGGPTIPMGAVLEGSAGADALGVGGTLLVLTGSLIDGGARLSVLASIGRGTHYQLEISSSSTGQRTSGRDSAVLVFPGVGRVQSPGDAGAGDAARMRLRLESARSLTALPRKLQVLAERSTHGTATAMVFDQGTAESPSPYQTREGVFSFSSAKATIGTFEADIVEGRSFRSDEETNHAAVRSAGFGPVRRGTGVFGESGGMLSFVGELGERSGEVETLFSARLD